MATGAENPELAGLSQMDKTVISSIDSKIKTLESKIDSESAARARLNYEANPASDMGGIRSKSAKAKERNFNSMLNHAKKGVELAKERDNLVTARKNYIKFTKTADAAEKMIARGARSDGTKLSRSELKEIKSIAKDYTGYASSIRIKYGR